MLMNHNLWQTSRAEKTHFTNTDRLSWLTFQYVNSSSVLVSSLGVLLHSIRQNLTLAGLWKQQNKDKIPEHKSSAITFIYDTVIKTRYKTELLLHIYA